MSNGNWMKGLPIISSEAKLDQFLLVWEKVQGWQTSPAPDSIKWNFNAYEKYSARSSHDIQFFGRIPQPQLERVWKSNAEDKVNFRISTLLQKRPWTADRLGVRNWPHNEACVFSDQQLESSAHVTLLSAFSKEILCKASSWQPRVASISSSSRSIKEWWNKICRGKREILRCPQLFQTVHFF